MRSPISAADLLRAFAALDPKTDEERRAIADMLGFEWQTAFATDAAPTVEPEWPKERTPSTPPKPPPPPQRPPAPRSDAPKATGGVRISGPRPVPKPVLDWLNTVPALPAGAMGRAHDPAPLFRPQWIRAILGASLSARRPIGPPDLGRAVEKIARGEALQTLPRQPIMTLARGVQVLLDIGESMQPFAQDRVVLRRDLKRIVGDGSLDILQFAGSPRQTRRDDDSPAWQDYETRFPPQLDACVLIVSDFGIGRASGLARGASPYTWSMLAKRLARRGHRVVGFVPYPPARWPSVLGRAVALVQWDRATTAGRISLARSRRAAA
jgi:hypothetical protein